MIVNLEMREAFYRTLHDMMKEDERIVVLDSDLGNANNTIKLKNDFKDRYIDVGVQEQNMASVAAGFASYGYIPFITTFTPFATRRICDQIAVSIAYAKMNVKIVGTDVGVTAELNGGTHMSFEDIGVVRSIPDLMIFEPTDSTQLSQALPHITHYNGPVYLRMLRKYNEPVLPSSYKYEPFKADIIQEGSDITLFASGMMVKYAQEAAKELSITKGIECEIINIHTIKPLDENTIVQSVRKTGCAVVLDNHNIIGGLGSAVCEVICERYPVYVGRVGVKDRFGEVGKVPYLMETLGMGVSDIVETCKKTLARKER